MDTILTTDNISTVISAIALIIVAIKSILLGKDKKNLKWKLESAESMIKELQSALKPKTTVETSHKEFAVLEDNKFLRKPEKKPTTKSLKNKSNTRKGKK